MKVFSLVYANNDLGVTTLQSRKCIVAKIEEKG